MSAHRSSASTLSRVLVATGLVLSLAVIAAAAENPAPAAPAPPVVAVPYKEAVLKAANGLFSKASPDDASGQSDARRMVVIDPLVDGTTGVQSVATQSMETEITELLRSKYPQFDVQPFLGANLAKSPLVFIGTFTPVNTQGQTTGARDAYRICLALLDTKTGKVISKAREFAEPQGVDITPTRFFRDSPTWAPDPAVDGYIKTCQGTKPGDPINPLYWDRIMSAALVSEAIDAYDSGQYRRALDLYKSAQSSPGGDQLRVLNGLYLTTLKLRQPGAANEAFRQIVDYGLENQRLGVKFLFRPGSTGFVGDRRVSGQYGMWLKQIAERTAHKQGCLEVVGHSSPTGPEPLNERLSLLRAQQIKDRLNADAPELANRTIVNGVGSRENLVGLGTDDARDALDRRVEFRVIDCAVPKT
jgi:outer membrane protein OmpA-like peptidoglycan-associated protein